MIWIQLEKLFLCWFRVGKNEYYFVLDSSSLFFGPRLLGRAKRDQHQRLYDRKNHRDLPWSMLCIVNFYSLCTSVKKQNWTIWVHHWCLCFLPTLKVHDFHYMHLKIVIHPNRTKSYLQDKCQDVSIKVKNGYFFTKQSFERWQAQVSRSTLVSNCLWKCIFLYSLWDKKVRKETS